VSAAAKTNYALVTGQLADRTAFSCSTGGSINTAAYIAWHSGQMHKEETSLKSKEMAYAQPS
jgi:hypothetical protein